MAFTLTRGRLCKRAVTIVAISSKAFAPKTLRATYSIAGHGHSTLRVDNYRQRKPLDLNDSVVKAAAKARFKEFDLANRAAIVTGGAQGLGLAMAEVLVEAGGQGGFPRLEFC